MEGYFTSKDIDYVAEGTIHPSVIERMVLHGNLEIDLLKTLENNENIKLYK